ncbi:hypothetical protein CK203_087423 [Vitis vinifera]|uniref:Uncharacterized protein n=1 Tax=Vitis vinifera TaxID=29760 RepID=A0A438D2V8_VITVI|nr:hypothetical protein CK203_087423 [Vitis vinifera]
MGGGSGIRVDLQDNVCMERGDFARICRGEGGWSCAGQGAAGGVGEMLRIGSEDGRGRMDVWSVVETAGGVASPGPSGNTSM